jgi:uncharacterized protein (TIGR03437 family)
LIASLIFADNSNLYFASSDNLLPRVKTGVVDASGQLQGSLVTIDAPAQPGNIHVFAIRLLPGVDGEIWVAYQVFGTAGFNGAPILELAKVSTARGQVIFNRRIGAGSLADVSFTRAGNVKLLLQFPLSTEATTADAPLVAGCGNSSYFAIISPSGQTVYATYVPSTIDFALQNESQSPAPAGIACFANSAGRFPLPSAAPGQLITITGGGFGPAAAIYSAPDSSGKYPLTFGGFRVRIAGIDAPIIALARGLIAAQVPYGAPAASVPSSIEVFDNGTPLDPIPFNYTGHALGFFDTGDRNNSLGLPAFAALNQDGSVNGESNPAPAGSIVSLFGSGLGALSPPLTTGGLSPIPPAGPLSQSSLVRTCYGCEILYLGSAPGLSTSVVQANVRLSTDDAITGVHPHGIGIAVSESSKTLFIFAAGGIVFVK